MNAINDGTFDDDSTAACYSASPVVVLGAGTYTLSSALRVTASALTIRGQGIGATDNTTIDAKGSAGVFEIEGSAELADVVVTGGDANDGGGAYVAPNGSLTLSGTTKVTSSTADWGGGVFVDRQASLTLKDNATITGNQADDGAGIYIYANGSATVTDQATVTANTAADEAGGIFVDDDATVTLSGSAVVSKNVAQLPGAGLRVATNGTATVSSSAAVCENEAPAGTTSDCAGTSACGTNNGTCPP